LLLRQILCHIDSSVVATTLAPATTTSCQKTRLRSTTLAPATTTSCERKRLRSPVWHV